MYFLSSEVLPESNPTKKSLSQGTSRDGRALIFLPDDLKGRAQLQCIEIGRKAKRAVGHQGVSLVRVVIA